MAVLMRWAATAYPAGFAAAAAAAEAELAAPEAAVVASPSLVVVVVVADVVLPSREGRHWTFAASSAASSCPAVASVGPEPGFRGSILDHQLVGRSAAAAVAAAVVVVVAAVAAGSAAEFVAAFGASAHDIVAASASSSVDDLIAARAVAVVVQVAAVNFAAGRVVVGLAVVAVAADLPAVTSDQECLLALAQIRGDPMIRLKCSWPTST